MPRRLLTTLFVMAYACAAVAQTDVKPSMDRSPVDRRSFDESAIRSLREDPAYRYDRQAPPDPGLLSRLVGRFWAWIDRLLQNPGLDTGFRILRWALPSLLVLYAIVRLTGMEKAMPWRRDRTPLTFAVRTEDVHAVDFPAEIALAVSEARFRDATRLHYLHALRHLSEAGRIRWTGDKTNRDYTRELEGSPLAPSFREVTRIFEFAWYGEMPITEIEYAGIAERFAGFHERIGA